jgi:hypothetical protein
MAGSAYAQGNGKGNGGGGNGHGGGKPAAASMQGGGGGGNAKPGKGAEGRGGGSTMAASMRGGSNDGARGGDNADRGNGKGKSQTARVERGNDNAMRGNERGNATVRAERGNGNADRAKVDRGNSGRGNGNDNRVERVSNDRGRDNDNRTVIVDRRGDRDGIERVRDFGSIRSVGLIDGCPPGLAKKNPPCVPPGQVRNDRNDWLRGFDRPDFWGLSGLGRDGRYFYDDGYLMRMDGNRIGGFVPLLGGALGIGNPWPSFYEPVALPGYYESYYGLGPYDSYRYADNVVYRVDPETAAITSIAALLTGDDFTVGRPMPMGYDVYNVPYSYRDQYRDGPDALYRYSDGYVYQVDPETRLIAAAIELLT